MVTRIVYVSTPDGAEHEKRSNAEAYTHAVLILPPSHRSDDEPEESDPESAPVWQVVFHETRAAAETQTEAHRYFNTESYVVQVHER